MANFNILDYTPSNTESIKTFDDLKFEANVYSDKRAYLDFGNGYSVSVIDDFIGGLHGIELYEVAIFKDDDFAREYGESGVIQHLNRNDVTNIMAYLQHKAAE